MELDPIVRVKAATLWGAFTKQQRSLVRFGMFPAEEMETALKQLGNLPDVHRQLAVALMDCAKADGGMRA